MTVKRFVKIFAVLSLAILTGSGSFPAIADQPKDKEGPGKGLVFMESYPEEIKGVYLAGKTGEVLVQGEHFVKFYDVNGKLLWKKDDLKFTTGAGVSQDGGVIIYQTSPVPKTGQITMLDLTIHILDHRGQEVLSKLNPYRYFTSILSPTGAYIVFGEVLAKKIYVYDRSMNPLWEREAYIWYIGFDPEEQFIYDSTSGMILNLQGRRVWELSTGMKFLGISSQAEVVLSQPFLTIGQNRNKIYLTNRVSLEQVILEGYCAGVSYDGGLVAYQGLDRKVQVWRTRELFEKSQGRGTGSALWTGEIYLARLLQFSRDAQTLLIYGETSQKSGKALLMDLNRYKNLWNKEWFNPPAKYLASEENRFLLVETSPTGMEYYCLR